MKIDKFFNKLKACKNKSSMMRFAEAAPPIEYSEEEF